MQFLTKLFKIVVGIFLLPVCVGAVLTLWEVISKSGKAESIWITVLSGAVVWVLIYIFLPKPIWIYVFGHELTHAIWSWIFGGHLKKMKVSSDGGHVLITKSNFLTSLAPYFFPIYVVFLVVIFAVGSIFWNWNQYVLLFYFLIGVMYAFHITLTSHVLKTEQSDIKNEGYIFGGVIIFLGNMLVLLIGIPLLTKMNMQNALNLWLNNSMQVYNYISLHLSLYL